MQDLQEKNCQAPPTPLAEPPRSSVVASRSRPGLARESTLARGELRTTLCKAGRPRGRLAVCGSPAPTHPTCPITWWSPCPCPWLPFPCPCPCAQFAAPCLGELHVEHLCRLPSWQGFAQPESRLKFQQSSFGRPPAAAAFAFCWRFWFAAQVSFANSRIRTFFPRLGGGASGCS